ncbi:hypothetical protein FACS1894160_3150 [Bacteroidia bacterium]|nr:hypothetical protein FACS1894123_05400 [Bacteroidia bacterium]GHV08597.1 hypothetical protein FACS1894160_3150 [Bacteroidia bacterium]
MQVYLNAVFKEGFQQDSIQRAISLIDESIALDSTYRLAYPTKVTFFDVQSKFTESVAVINSALRHNQEDPDLFIVRGILNEKLNCFDASKSDYSKAISLFDKMIEKDTI